MSAARELTDLTAVVLNWRTPEMSLAAARSLLADGLPEQRLVLADNGSGDGSAERFATELPAATILALPRNVGFAAANNRAAAALPSSTAYLFVNSDAFVRSPGSVGRLLGALADPGVGAVVPRLCNRDGSLQRSVFPLSTPLPELIRALGASRLVPDQLAPRLGAHWSHDRSREVPSAVGAVVLVRAQAWSQLRGFDERRHMYAEDLDLFWRLRALGWSAWFEAQAEFTHLGGASSAHRWDAPERARQVAGAEAEMLSSHLHGARRSATLLTMAAGVAARALACRAAGKPAAARALAAAARGYAGGLRSPSPAASPDTAARPGLEK